MKTLMNLSIAFLLNLPSAVEAQDLSIHLWEKRPVLVFADDSKDQAYYQQMKMLNADFAALQERNIVIYGNNISSANASLRKKHRPKGFTFILIGKDGSVKYRSEEPVSTTKLFSLIDAMPIRQREMQNQN